MLHQAQTSPLVSCLHSPVVPAWGWPRTDQQLLPTNMPFRCRDHCSDAHRKCPAQHLVLNQELQPGQYKGQAFWGAIHLPYWQTWAVANSKFYDQPTLQNMPTLSPSQSDLRAPARGTTACSHWSFERTAAGKQTGGPLSQAQEENRTLENCKAKDAKRDSSLSQLLTIEISPHLGMTSADLIFCHQSLRACFNYAAHQQEFSF